VSGDIIDVTEIYERREGGAFYHRLDNLAAAITKDLGVVVNIMSWQKKIIPPEIQLHDSCA
jgi:hypothetical protein